MTDLNAVLDGMSKPDGRDPIEASGLAALPVEADLLDVAAPLRKLAAFLNSHDTLDRRVLRNRAVTELKRAKIQDAAGLVDAALGSTGTRAAQPGQGQIMTLSDPEPWPEVVEGVALLERLYALIIEYLVLPPGAADYLAVFALVTHTIDAFNVAPYIAVVSPTNSCGKTRLLEVLALIVRRPWRPVVLTGPVLFRGIEQRKPTTLIDEAEVVRNRGDAAENVRAILHAGYKRGVTVDRCVGDNHELQSFDVFGPKVFAAIGNLPATLLSRCVVIRMQRRARGERVGYWRPRVVEPRGRELSRQARRWAEDDLETLRCSDIEAPDFLGDRQAEVWQPLFAVADLVGGAWPDRLTAAAHALARGPDLGTKAVELLRDAYGVLIATGSDRIASVDLTSAVNSMEGRPWAEWKGKPITPNAIARLLVDFDIRPKPLWIAGKTVNGYTRESFVDAYTRYLQPQDPQESRDDGGNSGVSNPKALPALGVGESGKRPEKMGGLGALGVGDMGGEGLDPDEAARAAMREGA